MKKEVLGIATATALVTSGCAVAQLESAAPDDRLRIIDELESGVYVYPGAFTVELPNQAGKHTMVRGFVEADGRFGCDPSVWEIDGSELDLNGIFAVSSADSLYQVNEWPRDPKFREQIGKKTLHCVQFNSVVDDYEIGELPTQANFADDKLRVGQIVSGDVQTNQFILSPQQ